MSEKLNQSLDARATAELKSTIERLSTASAKLDAGLTDLKPLLADLGAPINTMPSTNFGQTLMRANRIASDVNLLTRTLSDGKGSLNPNGSIQQLSSARHSTTTSIRWRMTATDVVNSFHPNWSR